MISPSEMTSELLKACPEILEQWNEHVRWMERIGKPRTIDADALRIASFLDEFYKARQTHIFPRFFAFAEQMLEQGDPETQKAIGTILEKMRRTLVTRMNGIELYASWMGPKTVQRWLLIDSELTAKNPKIAGKPRRRRIRPEHLREYKVTVTRCEPGEPSVPSDYRETMDAGTATKLGGKPNWLQTDMRPKCCCCNQPMTFIAQIDSLEHIGIKQAEHLDAESRQTLRKDQQWMFGDVGMIYVFFCFDCCETESVFQCH